MGKPDYGEIESITYHSCSLVLEVNVQSSRRGLSREAVLGSYPSKLEGQVDMGQPAWWFDCPIHELVRPFVEAVKRQDRIALEEVERVLRAEHRRESAFRCALDAEEEPPLVMYDPEVYDRAAVCQNPKCSSLAVENLQIAWPVELRPRVWPFHEFDLCVCLAHREWGLAKQAGSIALVQRRVRGEA